MVETDLLVSLWVIYLWLEKIHHGNCGGKVGGLFNLFVMNLKFWACILHENNKSQTGQK